MLPINSGALVNTKILVSGNPIQDTVDILSISISKSTQNEIQIQIIDPNFKTANSDTFQIGNLIEVQAGYDNKTKTICNASLTEKRIEFNNEQNDILTLKCSSENIITKTQNNSSETFIIGEDVIKASLFKNVFNKNTINGSILTYGRAKITVSDFVTLKGFGKEFDGKITVDSLHHSINNGNWLTTYYFGNNE